MGKSLYIIAGCNGAGKTTASFTILPEILDCKEFVNAVALAIDRVAERVRKGGHHIETEVIRRRYEGSLRNLFEIYLPIVDEVMIFDNSYGQIELIAERGIGDAEMVIANAAKFQKLRSQNDEKAKGSI